MRGTDQTTTIDDSRRGMNSDTRQLNHLVVHSVIDSLVVAPRCANCAWVDRVGLFSAIHGHSFLSFFFHTTISAMCFIRGRWGCLYHNQRGIARISRLPAIRVPEGKRTRRKLTTSEDRFINALRRIYSYANDWAIDLCDCWVMMRFHERTSLLSRTLYHDKSKNSISKN